jgi:hypothetical protein
VTVEPTSEGVAFSTERNDDVMRRPLMWYEISRPDGWIFSLTYQIDLVSDLIDPEDYGDDHEEFPIHMVVTTVNPSEANYIIWPEVDFLGFTSFTVVYDPTTAEDSYNASSYIVLNRYNVYEGYLTVQEYVGKRTRLREGIAIETPPFTVPSDHSGPLYVVVMGGAGHSAYNLKFVELGQTPMRSTMPMQYACHARSHAVRDAPPKLDCALAGGKKSHTQCASAFKYNSTYAGDGTGCMITADRGGGPWCVLATDANGHCRDGCKDKDEGRTWDYCVEPIQREQCVEFCKETIGVESLLFWSQLYIYIYISNRYLTIGVESGEVCAAQWKTTEMSTFASGCIADKRVNQGESWCALRVSEQDNICAWVSSVYVFWGGLHSVTRNCIRLKDVDWLEIHLFL